jgi:hypothetical protein
MRTVEESKKYQASINGSWIPVHWEQIDKGDMIRILSPDGTPISDAGDAAHNLTMLVVTESPCIRVEPLGSEHNIIPPTVSKPVPMSFFKSLMIFALVGAAGWAFLDSMANLINVVKQPVVQTTDLGWNVILWLRFWLPIILIGGVIK